MELTYKPTEITSCIDAMQSGGIVLYPTDTIWGLGCDATNGEAVQKISNLKKRQSEKSFVVLVASLEQLALYVEEIPTQLGMLVEQHAMPVSFVIEGGRKLAEQVISQDGTIAIRIPKDEFCLQLIRSLGVPIVSTSANFSGHQAPVLFNEIDPAIVRQVDYAVHYRRGDTKRASPSKILYVSPGGDVRVIRE